MQSDWPQAERAELLALFGVPRAILPMVLAMPMAAMSAARAPASRRALRQVSTVVAHKSSDLAAGGKVLRELALGNGGDRVSARNSMARGDVVPCSMGRT